MAKFRLFAAAIVVLSAAIAVLPTDEELVPGTTKNRSCDEFARTDAVYGLDADAANTENVAPVRTASRGGVRAEPWLDHPFEFTLRTVAVARDGMPSRGETVLIALPGTELNDPGEPTTDDGGVSVQWRSRREEGTAIVRDGRGTLYAVALRHGTTTDLAVRGRSTSREACDYVPLGNGFVIPPTQLTTSRHPFAVFGNDVAIAEESWLTKRLFGPRPPGIRFPPPTPSRAIFGEPRSTTLRGKVLGIHGEPVANADVALLDHSPQPVTRTTTDDAGHYTLRTPATGTFHVRASDGAAGVGTTPIDTNDVDPVVHVVLHRSRVLRGRVVRDATDAPCEIEWRADDESACRATTVASDGTFAFADLPPQSGRLLVWLGDVRVPVASTDVASTTAVVEMQVPPHASRIVLQFDRPECHGFAPIEVRAWQLESGLGLCASCRSDGSCSFAKLARGRYHLEAIAAGRGHADLGVHWVDGEHELDLGNVPLPRPAMVRFTIEAGATAELCALRDDADVHVPVSFGNDTPHFLPGGDYAMAVTERTGTVRYVRFTARAGTETVVATQ